ncbi:MAG: PP2C family protein-serine/threonine phosphatase [Actinomycetota bacterium]
MTGRWSTVSGVAAGMGVIAAVVTLDVLSGPGASVAGAIAAAPFVTAVLAEWRTTVAVSVASLVAVTTILLNTDVTAAEVIARGGAVLLAAVVAPAAAAARERRERALAEVTRVAEVAQRALLAPLPRLAGSVALAGRYLSASREALVGGDLYAAAVREGAVRVIVGDVRGKGLDAVALAALTIAAFRETAARPDLRVVAGWLDERLRPHLSPEDFVTALVADVHDDGMVRLVTCGHPPPVLVHEGARTVVDTGTPAVPVGLAPAPEVAELRLAPGDRLLLYTDGLVEARDARGDFVEPDDVLGGLAVADLDAALDRVLSDLRHRVPEIRDDLALVLLEYVGTPVKTPPRWRVIDLDRRASGQRAGARPQHTLAAPGAAPAHRTTRIRTRAPAP